MSDIPAYWLLADDQLSLAFRPKLAKTLKAALIHTLCFEDSVLLNDSYCINNLNFRTLVREDETFRRILRESSFRIAVRSDDDRDLRQIRDSYIGKQSYPQHFPLAAYRSSEELAFLSEHCKPVAYSVARLAKRYSEETAKLFRRPDVIATLDALLVAEINRFIEEKTVNEVQLGLSDFWYERGELHLRINQSLGEQTWERYGAQIRHIARAPYLTGVLSEVHAHPVYASEHSLSIDLWRERVETVSSVLMEPITFSSRIGDLTTYVHALSQLDVDHIQILHTSPEWHAYRECTVGLSDRDEDIRKLRETYLAYKYRVESELAARILGSTLPNPQQHTVTTNLHQTTGTGKRRAFVVLTTTVLDALLHTLAHIPVPLFGIIHVFNEFRHQDDTQDRINEAAKTAKMQALMEQESIQEARVRLSQQASGSSPEAEQIHVAEQIHSFQSRDTLIQSSSAPAAHALSR